MSFFYKNVKNKVNTAYPQVSAFCDETWEESAKLGLLLKQVDSHETRTKDLRALIKYRG